ncbi:MAG: MBL fold metallo-hydrolase [Candidatus Shapirobacteria bacterium]|jgi:competence protein ComEC
MKLKISWLVVAVWLLMVGWVAWGEFKKPKQVVIFCNVGQGDMAIVIDGGFQMIVDTGPTGRAGVECLERNLPIWDRKIEVAIITHGDADHSGGLVEIQKSYLVEKINVSEGDVVRYGEVEFRVISGSLDFARDENEGSIIGVLEYGDKTFYMMADATAEMEQGLVWRQKLESTNLRIYESRVLKVSHHGSRDGTTKELLETIKPAEAVISVGKNNYGHPATETIKRLEEFEVRVRRTDREGDITYKILNF